MAPKRGEIDRILLIATVMLAVLGILFLYSATHDVGRLSAGMPSLVIKQCVWVLVGFAFVFLIIHSDYIRILDFAYIAYALNLLLLVFLLVAGGERYGAKRWIGLGPFSLQPSEFVKLTVIFSLAAFLGSRKDKMGSLDNFIYACAITMPAFGLIFLQPDLGTALILVPILFSILFICGENIKYMYTTVIGGLVSLPVLWNLLKDYQRNRLLVFINPNIDPLGAGYTIIQSKIAIGSGGFLGKGWLGGTQSHLKFLPEKHTDFIFSVIGEEWGFVGAVVLLSLYIVIISRGIKIIAGIDDIYSKAIATGVVTLLAFQVFVNISMTIGLMPVVGLPLPLVSYGGSNVIATLTGIGFLLAISRRRIR
jgi:rod shape determining protein RodA